MGRLGATIAEGMAFGAGYAMGRKALDAIMSPTVASTFSSAGSAPSNSSLAGSDACDGQSVALRHCLNNYGSDISKCQIYMDMLQECRKSTAINLDA